MLNAKRIFDNYPNSLFVGIITIFKDMKEIEKYIAKQKKSNPYYYELKFKKYSFLFIINNIY